MLYILCTLILSNSFHITIGSSLILIQMIFDFQNVVMHILNVFSYVQDFQKMSSRFQLTTYLSYLLYITFLGEKWPIYSVILPDIPIMQCQIQIWFHPRSFSFGNAFTIGLYFRKNSQCIWRALYIHKYTSQNKGGTYILFFKNEIKMKGKLCLLIKFTTW